MVSRACYELILRSSPLLEKASPKFESDFIYIVHIDIPLTKLQRADAEHWMIYKWVVGLGLHFLSNSGLFQPCRDYAVRLIYLPPMLCIAFTHFL